MQDIGSGDEKTTCAIGICIHIGSIIQSVTIIFAYKIA